MNKINDNIETGFLSSHVEKSSYYFLKLTGPYRHGLGVACGGRERCLPGYNVVRDGFRYFSIEFVVEGRGTLTLEDGVYSLGPGVAFGYGPGIKHRIVSDGETPMTKYFVDFSGREAARFFRDTACCVRPVQVTDPSRIRDVYDDLERSARYGGGRVEDSCVLLLRLLALRIGDLALSGRAYQGRALKNYQRCRAVLDARMESLHSLADMADACGVAPEYLCRLFKRFGSCTPYQYLQRRTMERAANLLQHGSLLVKEVAEMTGSSDAFHFSRTFKRVHGVSPQHFVAMNRRG